MRRFALILAFIGLLALNCAAQQASPPRNESAPRIDADESFNLDITERRITENDFFASTSVGFGEANHVSLHIGVELGARRIDVLMRNVQGTVRFRGSVQKILDLISARPPRPQR